MSGVINHGERAHSEIGASGTDRWFPCPASVNLCRGLPNSSSVFAEEGTAAHELGEHCLIEDIEPHSLIGKEEFNGFPVTEDMADAVKVYVDFIRNSGGSGYELLLEHRFNLEEIDKELFGTGDAILYEYLGELHIIDYKHGKGVAVEAKENTQLLYYALGAAKAFDEYSSVKLTIVQPRCIHPDGPIRSWVTTPERLADFKTELKSAVDATREKNPRFQPTDKGCKFCKAKATCPALRDEAMSLAKVEFDDVEPTLPEPKDLTLDEISKLLKVASRMESWLKAVQGHAQGLAESGHVIEGMKLVKKKANRKWSSETEVIEDLHDIYEDSIYAPRKLKTPRQLEAIIGKTEVANYCHTPDTGVTLVKETDKRKAVELITAKDEFNI